MTNGYPIWVSLLVGLVFAVVVGTIVGFLIAYVEIPALFATLAMGAFVYGFGRYAIFDKNLSAQTARKPRQACGRSSAPRHSRCRFAGKTG